MIMDTFEIIANLYYANMFEIVICENENDKIGNYNKRIKTTGRCPQAKETIFINDIDYKVIEVTNSIRKFCKDTMNFPTVYVTKNQENNKSEIW